ncbi:hypothetical protein [Pseudomonas sp. SMN5]|uniref:hypothetical protein n=1 Tax=Pseudomonas sp. SMN5 TaxID=3390198 RepID=UPI003F83186B
MSLSVVEKIFLSVSLTGFGGVLVFLALALYIAYTKMDEILSHLKNSPFVMNRASFRHGGPWGKLFLLGSIVSVIKSPGLYTSDGGASNQDLVSFPESLKKKLIALYRFGGYFSWILILCWFIFCIDWWAMGPARLTTALLLTAAIPGWVALCLWLGQKNTDTIISNFKNSSAINIRARLSKGGRFGKLTFMIAILIIVTCGRIFVRRGTLDPTELNNLSNSLKVKLSLMFWAGCILILSLLLLYLSH